MNCVLVSPWVAFNPMGDGHSQQLITFMQVKCDQTIKYFITKTLYLNIRSFLHILTSGKVTHGTGRMAQSESTDVSIGPTSCPLSDLAVPSLLTTFPVKPWPSYWTPECMILSTHFHRSIHYSVS